MDTNLNIPVQKKVVSVEILHLHEPGYGPQGKHTRREWRAECLENLLAGKERFESWQSNVLELIDVQLNKRNFDCQYISNDKKSESYLYLGALEPQFPWTLDFILQEFNESLNCKNFIFNIIAIFAGATYQHDVNFENSVFRENAYFCGGKFRGEFSCVNSFFNKTADFSACSFSQFVVYLDSNFFGNAFFNNAKFISWVRFGSCNFKKEVRFRYVSFKKGGDFRNAKFGYLTDFGWSIFNGKIDCNSCSFNGLLDFAYSQIDEIADFGHCDFKEFIDFTSTKFAKDAIFKNSIFDGDIYFKNSIFSGDAIFNSVIFNKNADFLKAIFCNQIRFDKLQDSQTKEWSRETEFLGEANFENATFENVGHFDQVRFKGEIPNFLGVDNAKTVLIFSDDEYFSKEDTSENAIKHLAQLKRLADEQGQTDQALMFNAFELNAKREYSLDAVKHLKWWQKLFNGHAWLAWTTYAYDKLSNYGRSFTRPLLAYGVLMLVTFVLALGHGLWASMDACEREGWNVYEQLYRDQVNCPVVATVGEQKIPLTVPRAAFEYSAYRASGILDFVDADKQTIAVANRLFNQPIEPIWMRIWGVLKAIVSAALLFLAALGLRNKYRIK